MLQPLHAVTGPFGYSGRRIAQRLLDAGVAVRGLTNSPRRGHGFGDRIDVRPLAFERRDQLIESLRGVDVLYNTYWIRFNHRRTAGDFTRAQAVVNSLVLFDAARRAGVRRIVHVSVANPSEDSPFEYYRGKARLERAVRESGLSYAILRPAVLFGDEDILINNIAWMLRTFPVFGIFGRGQYGIRPIHVDDFAALAVRCGGAIGDEGGSASGSGRESGSEKGNGSDKGIESEKGSGSHKGSGIANDNPTIDAVGPEHFAYRDLVRRIAEIIGVRRRFIRVPAEVGYWIGRATGLAVQDIILTRDEIGALMAGLLDSDGPSTGETRLTDWAALHAATLGRRYASELARRRDRVSSYEQIMR